MNRDDITVFELIEILKKLPHDMSIVSYCTESGYLNNISDKKIEVIEIVRDINTSHHGGRHVEASELEWFVNDANRHDDQKIDINECVKEKVLAIG